MKPKIPEAFKALPDSANLDISDIAVIFGLSLSTAKAYSSKGKLPAHNKTLSDINASKKAKRGRSTMHKSRCSNKRYWRLGDVRAYIEKLESEAT